MKTKMNKQTFHKKWYFPILAVIFWGSLAFWMYIGLWAILYEDDMPFIGVIWIVVFIFVYWLAKRMFYRVMFGERLLPFR